MNGMAMKAGKLAFPLLLMAGGAAIFFGSNSIRLTVAVEQGNIVNARFYPRLVGMVFVALAAAELIASIRQLVSERSVPAEAVAPGSEEPHDPASRANAIRLASFVGMMAVYQILFFVVGFVPSTVLFLIGGFRLLGCTDWIKLVGGSVATVATIYVVFVLLLSVPLPRGMLF